MITVQLRKESFDSFIIARIKALAFRRSAYPLEITSRASQKGKERLSMSRVLCLSVVGKALVLFLRYCSAGDAMQLQHKGDCYEGTAVSDSKRTDQIHKTKI